MHNLSSRGLVAYVLDGGGDSKGIAISREIYSTVDHPSITPRGDSQKELFTFAQVGRMTPRITVVAAIFTDGSYEGDVDVAAKLKARQIGALTVDRLLKPAIDRVVQDQSMNDEARTARIKDEIFRVPSQPENAATHSLQSQFPDLPTQEAIADLTHGVNAAKNDIWGDLYGYMHKCCEYPPPDHISLAKWWHGERGTEFGKFMAECLRRGLPLAREIQVTKGNPERPSSEEHEC